ncbi:MAG: translation initiation factor IF-3 [Rickettsiales bacterium]
MNKQIIADQVRLINENGEMIGIVSIQEALRFAFEASLDLVEISPAANPPVCKIMDFTKFKYEEKKKALEMKKKQKTLEIKEIKIRPSIAINDLNTKIKSLQNFILDGNHVKVSIIHKGREIIHKENSRKIFSKIIEDVQDIAKIDHEPKFLGNILYMKLIPLSK